MTAPKFFVPLFPPEDQEAAYTALARRRKLPVPSLDRRIYSVTFKADGEEWVATVGEKLRGTAPARGRRLARSLTDPATVIAIFQSSPYFVFTDKGREGVRSAWENPFMAGGITKVVLFSTSE